MVETYKSHEGKRYADTKFTFHPMGLLRNYPDFIATKKILVNKTNFLKNNLIFKNVIIGFYMAMFDKIGHPL